MKKLEELLTEEEKLEREKIDCLEIDDNKNAKKIEKKIYRIRQLIEIEREGGYIQINQELKICKDFIKNKGLEKEFNNFYNKKIKEYI